MTFEAARPTQEHIEYLAENMSELDTQEVWAAGHATPLEALKFSMMVSRDTMVWLGDGKAVCICGIGNPAFISDVGSPWMLATEDLKKFSKQFLRESKRFMAKAKKEHRFLVNYVDVRNKPSVKWLKWLGFNLLPAEPYGVDELPFHRFEMRS